MAYSEFALRETSSDVCELSDGLGFLGAPAGIFRTGSLTTVSFPQGRVVTVNPLCAPWEQDSALCRGLPLTPAPIDVSKDHPITMNRLGAV